MSLLNAPGACTQEVRSKILELIQTWATAFEGMPQLSYVADVYNRLENEGHDFPPRTRITSSFVDSSAVSFLLSAHYFLNHSNSPSLQNGQIQMCVCGVERHLHLPIANITAGIVAASFVDRVHRKICHYQILGSCNLSGCVMAAISS